MDLKQTLWFVLFALSWFPVGMLFYSSTIGASGVYTQDFSIYNTSWNGASAFREDIEGMGYTALAIQSSMGVVTRYDGQAVLVIMGPVRDFSLDAVFVIFDHLMNGGGVVIADDFGTANSSFMMLNSLVSGAIAENAQSLPTSVSGVVAFTGGVLLDLDSYDKSPKLPVITDFRPGLDGGALTRGVSSLHLNWATAISPKCAIGMAGIAWTSNRAWCDTNISDPNPYPDNGEWNGSLPVVGALDLGLLVPGAGRMVAISDPSIFTNDMLDRGDNRQFAENVIDWLSYGQTNRTVVFCENLLAVPWYSAEFFYGLYLSRVFWLSTLPYVSMVYPFVTVTGIKKYLPDMKKPEVKAVSEVFLRRGQTYFSERMAYYRTEGNYARVVKMLYRKLRRDLQKKHMWSEFDAARVWDLLKYKDPSMNRDTFFKTISRIEKISANPTMKIRESEMMDLFFFMRNIQNKLIETRT
ncbi:MAG: hypothetical protein DRO93_03595 [Candidatus Thorarchaeota archaeon]|nr:MAG: hypothetical protein DRO93_03595 [Candidatus Thorarchaeota archaeon]